MLKTLMMSAAVSTLMVSGALAQANPPAAPPAAPAAKADAAPVDSAKFIQAQGTDQWVFSKFKGTDVIGPDNAQVGDVNDVLFDKGGKIVGLIVGVGGFLGIGEKSVAIDMSAFQPVPADTGSSTAGGNSAVQQQRSDQRETQSQLDEGSAQERSGLPVLQGTRAHDRAPGRIADDRHGATAGDPRRGALRVPRGALRVKSVRRALSI